MRREIVKDIMDGKVPLLTAEPLASIAEVDAPGTDVGDLVYVSGSLNSVRSFLADGGGMLKQMDLAQLTTVDFGEVAVVGDPDGTAPVVALAASGVLQRSDLVTIDGDRYRVGTLADWPAGGLLRYVLTPA